MLAHTNLFVKHEVSLTLASKMSTVAFWLKGGCGVMKRPKGGSTILTEIRHGRALSKIGLFFSNPIGGKDGGRMGNDHAGDYYTIHYVPTLRMPKLIGAKMQ